jgi:dTDP-4-dehydrorhamnose reductase
MKILLLGASGQLGFELRRSLSVLGNVVAAMRRREGSDADFSDPDALRALIQSERPHVIVNAAAYTAVDQAEAEQELAYQVNARAVRTIAEQAHELGALLVHVSTDYVFSGKNQLPWTELDPALPISAYGRSKLAGEQAVIESRCAYLILRVQGLYSARRSNFLRTMLKLAREQKPIRVVQDQIVAPTPVRWIADSIGCMLARWLIEHSDGESYSGIYHVAAAGQTNWFEFAKNIFHQAHVRGLISGVPDLQPITSAEFVAAAKRPKFSLFNCEKIKQDFDIVLPDWREGVALVLDELKEAKDWSFENK